MMKVKILLFGIFSFTLFFACSAQNPISEVHFSSQKKLSILDSTAAAASIISDRYDGFFEKVTASEISIQMKRPLNFGETPADLMQDYLLFLQNDVENFTSEESNFVAEVMEHVFKTCESVSKSIFPNEIKLIKTKGKHYGNSVYYTRENCIIIPKNELKDRNRAAFTTTMFHEVFHIYSRLNTKPRQALYRLIGFEHIGFQQLDLPEQLAARVLFNPDGTDFAQKIELLTKTGKNISAIPIIFANKVGFDKSHPEFFNYLEFNLFEVKATGNRWQVITAEDGFSSTLNMRELPDFFRQIRDNTHYIIHPDEVLADNFAFIMESKHNNQLTQRFSKAGKELLLDMEKILTSGSEGQTPDAIKNR